MVRVPSRRTEPGRLGSRRRHPPPAQGCGVRGRGSGAGRTHRRAARL